MQGSGAEGTEVGQGLRRELGHCEGAVGGPGRNRVENKGGCSGLEPPQESSPRRKGLRGCRRSVRDAELSGVLGQGPQRPALGEEDETKERVKRGRGERKERADRARERGERGKGISNRVLPAPGGSRAGPRASSLAGPSQRPPPSAARLLDDARRARAARSRPRARAPATMFARVHGPASSRACHARSGLVARAPGPHSPRLGERGRGFCRAGPVEVM